ncbi:hypothetical protein B0T25DRAFT_24656 [Lasiosphaeria hispida]|uniref:Uncharacterized protein n=1 Tax=Lasiosphaeria hispida TaxID=260671 RepID=A0AAJ0HUK2_9PEZI|nr:hypothetical protein B0T25DRAFT_24656 [Lasiosphaeria hispida]
MVAARASHPSPSITLDTQHSNQTRAPVLVSLLHKPLVKNLKTVTSMRIPFPLNESATSLPAVSTKCMETKLELSSHCGAAKKVCSSELSEAATCEIVLSEFLRSQFLFIFYPVRLVTDSRPAQAPGCEQSSQVVSLTTTWMLSTVNGDPHMAIMLFDIGQILLGLACIMLLGSSVKCNGPAQIPSIQLCLGLAGVWNCPYQSHS